MKTTILHSFVFYIMIFSNLQAQTIFLKAKVTTGEYGTLNMNFSLEKKENLYSGTTAIDAHKRVVGGLKGAFAKSSFEKNGSIMEIDSLTITENAVFGYLIFGKRKYMLKGLSENGGIKASIIGKKSGLTFGSFEATEVKQLQKPNDYVRIYDSIVAKTQSHIFKKSILEKKEWQNFVAEMKEFSSVAMDDGEFLYGFFLKAKNLPFSHFSIIGTKDERSNFAIPGNTKAADKLLPTLKSTENDTYLLDVPAFNFKANEIDVLMNELIVANPKNLIIDLRTNQGGFMEGAMRICEYLSEKPIYGGVMLSQHYWNKNENPPAAENYDQFKILNESNYEKFKAEVKKADDGLCFKTTPNKNVFKGKIYILTSSATASTSEPFVYALQLEKIATVVGEKTAGAMLSMEPFTISNFTYTIPMLDYYTKDGKRLDKIGVEPDIKCTKTEAYDVALKLTRDVK